VEAPKPEPMMKGEHHYRPARSLGFWSGRQGRKSYGVKIPCRQLPDSDD